MITIQSPPAIVKNFFQNLLSFLFNVRINNIETLKELKNGIIVCNHLDLIDLFIPLIYLPYKITTLYSYNFLRNTIFDILLNENLKNFYNFLDIKILSSSDIENTIIEIAQKNFLFIFPELNPSPTGILNPFDENIIKNIYFANLNQIPIIPSGIQGSYGISQSIQKMNFEFAKIKIQYNIGNPIITNSEIQLNTFIEELQKQVYALSQHPERRSKGRPLIRSDAREL